MRFLVCHEVEAHAERDPQHLAVSAGPASLTFGVAHRLSNTLAHRLAESAAAGERALLFVDKGPLAYVSILACMRAGHCYTPVDVSQPWSRLEVICQTAEPAIVIVEAVYDSLVPKIRAALPRAMVLVLAADPKAEPSLAETLPTLPARAVSTDVCYMLFTSGSTGKPKGVMVPHAAISSYGRWVVDTAGLTPSSRLLGHTPLYFDVSLYSLIGAMTGGATWVPVPRALDNNAKAVAELIDREQIDIWMSAPYLLTLLHGSTDFGKVPLDRLRVVAYCGEVLPNRTLIPWMEKLPAARFHNLYGPTEATVSCLGHVWEKPPRLDDPIPIGIPHDDVRVWLLDERGQPIDTPGHSGEIVIGGVQVARGYFHQPELTAEKFASLGELSQHAAVYRTGDLGQWDERGRVLFFGRRDHQVKIRGYRVELGEIEACLNAHPRVQKSCISAVHHKDDVVLVADIESDDPSLDEPALRKHCAERLPRYMIPFKVRLHSALPRSPAGKIDRPALALSATELVRTSLGG